MNEILNSKGKERQEYLNRITENSIQINKGLEEQLKQCFDNMATQLYTADRELKEGIAALKQPGK